VNNSYYILSVYAHHDSFGDFMVIKAFPKEPSKCYCTNMRRATRVITRYYDKHMEPSGLKVTQYSLLNHLKRLGPLTMNEFSKAIRLERTTLVRNLKPLENMGLVSIFEEESSKTRQVHLTDKGLEQLNKAVSYWNQAQQDLKEQFTDEEFSIFMGALQKLESIMA
jgi:DNA-binding MarR family transcriptional regulator